MRDLGMKQRSVKAPAIVRDCGKGCGLAPGDGAKASRQGVDLVTVAHPYLLARSLRPQPVKQKAVVEDLDNGAAEFLVLAQAHAPAQLVAHRLHPIADTKHRHAEPEDDVGRAWRGARGHRGRATREDDRPRIEVAHLVLARRERRNLAIDAALAHSPRDQLCHLAAEIEDQDAVGHGDCGSQAFGRRSNRATKKPSVPWRAGVRKR